MSVASERGPDVANAGLSQSTTVAPRQETATVGSGRRLPRRIASLETRGAWVPVLFALLALAYVGPALLPGRALLPIDNLFQFPPWRAYADDFDVGLPHNPLISDAILQNYSWKHLARESIARGELPLWNPYVLSGQPFLAAGQNGALYPPGVLFYVLPVDRAYAPFIALHLWLGALFAYLFARTLGATRLGGIVAGITFGFCGYLTVSFLWPMVVSTAIWLPALLLVIERLIVRGDATGRPDGPLATDARVAPDPERGQPAARSGSTDATPSAPHRRSMVACLPLLVALGAVVVGLQFLAGHLEMSLYLLITSGLYTALRLVGRLRLTGLARTLGSGLAALTMVLLGGGLAGILLVPFSEVIGANVRSSWSDYAETVGYALPPERAVAWLVPNFFGNPTHHTYLDVLDGEIRPVEHRRPNGEVRTDTEWGGKNYVEGTAYVGVLPLLLAAVAVARRPTGGGAALAIVGLISILLAFGTPLYALLFYGIPGANQLHTPFRWVYPLSLCLAVLAGLAHRPATPSRMGTTILDHAATPPRHLGATRPERAGTPMPDHPDTTMPDRAGTAMPDGAGRMSSPQRSRAPQVVGVLAVALGLVILASGAAALALPDRSLDLAARALRRWPELRQGFDQPRVLLSYQLMNLAGAALLLLAGGALIWLGARPRLMWLGAHGSGSRGAPRSSSPGARGSVSLGAHRLGVRRSAWLGVAAVALLVADLFAFGSAFNTAADTRPLSLVPRAIEAIQADPGPFRVVTLGGDDTLPANTNMLFGLQDVRGYDTIILRDYVEYLDLIEPQRDVPYSKIAKLYDPRSLDSPLLSLLNVKYVLTSQRVSRPGWALVYEGEGIRVYRNDRVIPRAFVVSDARVVPDHADALATIGAPWFDPRSTVVLEGSDDPRSDGSDGPRGQSVPTDAGGPRGRSTPSTGGGASQGQPSSTAGGAPQGNASTSGALIGQSATGTPTPLVPAQIEEYGANRVVVRASAPEGGVLVLGDVYFPGWRATVDGVRQPVLRANAIMRGVELSPGEHTVVFEYRPLSVQIGLVVSALSALSIGLLGGYALLRSRRPGAPPADSLTPEPAGGLQPEPTATLRRVAKNSAFPMAASLLNKGIDLAFALVMFRILQAEGVGAYTFAGVLVGYLDTLVGFGLGTLIIREVARDRSLAGRYLGSTTVVRLALWLASAAITAVLVGPLAGPLGIDAPLALTLWLLVLGLLPGIVSSALSALFMAHERLELPAIVTVVTTILKVALGLGALLAGWGYVGLAAVSVLTNVLTMLVLLGLYARALGLPRPAVDLAFGLGAMTAAFPLMLNGFLNALFFKIDAVLLKPLAGDLALGWYSTAYKIIDGLQIIPSSFVLAVFPLLSRHAGHDNARLCQVMTIALKVLLVLAFPIAVGTTILAESIVLVFAGPGFLPQSAWALQILIWYLPLSVVNGLTQYLLIALGRTRAITVGFAIGFAFNVAGNVILIPRVGYLGAAAVTIASEAVLLVPFWSAARRELPSLSLFGVIWRPALAALVMAGPVWLANAWSPLAAIPIGALIYGAAILALGTFGPSERRAALDLLHRRSHPPAVGTPAS